MIHVPYRTILPWLAYFPPCNIATAASSSSRSLIIAFYPQRPFVPSTSCVSELFQCPSPPVCRRRLLPAYRAVSLIFCLLFVFPSANTVTGRGRNRRRPSHASPLSCRASNGVVEHAGLGPFLCLARRSALRLVDWWWLRESCGATSRFSSSSLPSSVNRDQKIIRSILWSCVAGVCLKKKKKKKGRSPLIHPVGWHTF
ncbi:hypothetical protein B0J12DRAFT_59677 [Macrophomina phaseolina]|uniref:Transmembrane protein n=1 Tax=Macrophomina phaseolina TaxID=35725 RepID=A0ABQ8FQ21_9PEZI|nr:hypothetical protein B0J12DRAFT_59677 [Macrophomina phaseolina]